MRVHPFQNLQLKILSINKSFDKCCLHFCPEKRGGNLNCPDIKILKFCDICNYTAEGNPKKIRCIYMYM